MHITTCRAGAPLPVQEIWVSRDLNEHLIRAKGTVVLWNLAGRKQTILDSASGSARTSPIAGDELAAAKAWLDKGTGMPPFRSPASAPAGAQWAQVASGPGSADGREVYELRWVDPGAGETGLRWRWRVTVDGRSDLPQRAEYYLKRAGDADYALETVLTFEYLTRDQMQAAIDVSTNLPTASPPARP